MEGGRVVAAQGRHFLLGRPCSASWAPQRDSVAAVETTKMQSEGSSSPRSAQALMRRGRVQQSGGAAGAEETIRGYVVCRVLSCLRRARATSGDAGLQTGCSVQQQQGRTGKGIAISRPRSGLLGEVWCKRSVI